MFDIIGNFNDNRQSENLDSKKKLSVFLEK